MYYYIKSDNKWAGEKVPINNVEKYVFFSLDIKRNSQLIMQGSHCIATVEDVIHIATNS